MPRVISFQFPSKAEETRFFTLLNGLSSRALNFKEESQAALLGKQAVLLADTAAFVNAMRSMLNEIEEMFRD